MGDSSDNIPGVPGIGEKIATNIIVKYGSIENAYAHVEEITPNRAKEALRNHYDMAQMSKTLATINIDCDYDYDWETARLSDIYTKEAYEIFRELEFKNMLSRFSVEAPANEAIEKGFRIVTELAETENLFEKAEKQERLAFELIHEGGEILALSLALSPQEVYIFPVQGFFTKGVLTERLSRVLAGVKEIVCLRLKEQLKFFGCKGIVGFLGYGDRCLSSESPERQLFLRRTGGGISGTFGALKS